MLIAALIAVAIAAVVIVVWSRRWSSPGRAIGRAAMSIVSLGVPRDERAEFREEIGGLVDAAADRGQTATAALHGISSLRALGPTAPLHALRARLLPRPHAAWAGWLVVAAGLVIIHMNTSRIGAWAPAYTGLAVVAAIVSFRAAAARRHERAAWVLIGFGLSAFVGGDVAYTLFEPAAFPSLVDASYLMVYALVAAGIIALWRATSDGSPVLILLLAVAASVASFAGFWWAIDPVGNPSLLAVAVGVSYPALDVLLVVLAFGLALRAGSMATPLTLLGVGAALLLVADLGYNLALANGNYAADTWLDSLWLGFYAMSAAAALFPSMSGAPPAPHRRLRPARRLT